MYRLLIVDDEPAIVDGLMQHIQELGTWELDVCKAYSGEEALELIRKTKFDLLVSDIRMPGISGLQLIDDLSYYWPSCRIILLTGHTEFDYAYKAIRKQVDHYLLKIEGIETILDAIASSLGKLDEEYCNRRLLERTRQTLTTAEPLLKKEFFESVLTGDHASSVRSHERFEGLSLRIDDQGFFFMIAGKVDSWDEKASYMKKMEVYAAIQERFEKHLPAQIQVETAVHDRSELVWFVQPVADAGKFNGESGGPDWQALTGYLKGMLEPIQSGIRDDLGIPVSFVIGNGPIHWNDAGDEFELMKSAFKRRAAFGPGMALIDLGQAGDAIKEAAGHAAASRNGDYNRKLGLLEKFIAEGNRDAATELTSALVGVLKEETKLDFMRGMEKYYSLLLVFLSAWNGIGYEDSYSNDIRITGLFALEAPVEWSSVEGQLVKLCGSIHRLKREQMENSENLTVERIHRYVNENLGGDLSLARIAAIVYFNPSYLSRFYKQVTGRNLSDYINGARAEKAERLLRDTPLKVNEIALKLGFESPSYFTSFFRKMFGSSPQEFRESVNK